MARNNLGFNKSKMTKIKMPISGGSWLTNAGKSLGMASMDILTEIMPATAETVTTAAESVANFRSSLNEMRSQRTQMKQAMDRSVYMDIAKTAIKNTGSDLLSGNLYHRASYDDGLGDMDMGDFDMGGDWDVGDDSDYDASFSSDDGMTQVSTSHRSGNDVDVNNVHVNVDIGNNSRLVQAMDAQTKVAVDNAKVALEYDKAFNRTLLAQMNQYGDKQASLLGSIDSNINTMVSIGETLAKSASLSAKYYDDSMSVFNTIAEHLNEIKTSVAGSNGPGADMSRYNNKYTNVLDDLFSSNGVLDPKAYAELAKKQLKNAAESNIFMSQIMNVMSDTDTLKSMFAHPINFVTQGIMKTLIPTAMRQAAESFDKTLQETMITALHRVRGLRDDSNPILAFLGESFGISNKLKTDVDKSNYNKGKVDWTGESHKTLNEVIPYYLRKIAAAVSGEEEMAFDYDKGVFKKLSVIQKEYKEEDNRRMIREFSGLVSDFKDSLDKNVQFTNKSVKENTVKDMEDMLRKIVKSDGTKAKRDSNNSFRTFIAETLGRSADDPAVQLISGFIDSRSNSEVMNLFGRGALEARAAFSKFKLDEEAGVLPSNSRYVNNGLGKTDSNLKIDSKTGEVQGVNYKTSPFIEHDKYGKTPTKYLRDIYSLLLEGIIVFPVNNDKDVRYKRKRSADWNKYQTRMDRIQGQIDRMGNDYEEGYRPRETRTHEDITEAQANAARARGKFVVGSDADNNLSGQYAEAERQQQRDANRAQNSDSWFSRMTGIDPDKPISKIFHNITEFMKKPGAFGEKIFRTADDFLFKMVFGDKNDGPGVFSKGIAYVKKGFTKFSLWINDKILEPLQEKLFGENGLFDQIKKSQMFQDIKAGWGKFVTFLLGEKDSDGNRKGGLFSETANELKGIGKSIKYALFDKENPDSVLFNVKSIGSEAMDGVAAAFGVDVEERKRKRAQEGYSPIKDALNEISAHIKTRANGAMDMLFGPSGETADDRRKFADNVSADLKDAGGKLGAGALIGGVGAAFLGGKVGFVSSLFLPGGFIGGALLGLGVSVVKHSETVQQMLFGDLDDKGERQGGLIRKEVIDAFNDNKTGITLGAIGGMAGSLGLIPSFLLPGGPVGGALIGAGVSMAMKTKTMQNFLFGEDGESGLAGKFKNFFKNAEGVTDKGRFVDTGIGAGVGLIGGMFLGGPALGAILGSLAGFGASSKSFQDFLFGKEVDGKRQGGAIHKAINKVTDVVSPAIHKAQAKMLGWIERSIMIPFEAGFKPIVNLGANIVSGLATKAVNIFKTVGTGIKNFLIGDEKSGKKGILSPIVEASKFVLNATKNVALSIVSAPFKLIGAVGKALDLGSRLRNLLSPIIDLTIKPVLGLMKTAISKVTKTLTNLMVKAITLPFKIIKTAVLAPFKLLKGAGKLIMDHTFIGDAVRGASNKINQFKNGRVANTLDRMSTRRLKWGRDENGKLRIMNDDSYQYDNTKSGMSVGTEMKQKTRESRDWQDYQLAKYGDAKAAERLRNRYGKTAEELLNDDSLWAKKYKDKRKSFDEMLKHHSYWEKAEDAKAEDKKAKSHEENTWKLYQQAMSGDKTAQRKFRSRFKDRAEELLNSGVDFTKDRASFDQKLGLQAWWQTDETANATRIDEMSTNEIQTESMSVENLEISDSAIRSLAAKLAESLGIDNDRQKLVAQRRIERKLKRKRAQGLFPIPGTTPSDMEAGVEPIEDEPGDDLGHRAFGGKILETGKYWLSKGERVVSNIRDRWQDYKKERAAKHQYESMLGDNNFTNEDTGEATDAINSSFTNKSKAEEAAEHTAAVKRGMYDREKIEKKKLEDIERAEQSNFREKVLAAVENVGTKFGEYKSAWDGIFSKKGLLTMALIAGATWLTTKFPEEISNLISGITSALGDAWKNAGGIEGIVNNLSEKVDNVLKLFNDESAKEVDINEDGTINLNDNGTVAYKSDTNEAGRSPLHKLYDFIFPQQTRIDVDGSVTGTPGAAYTEENTYDAASGAKLTAGLKLIRKPLRSAIKNRAKISRVAGNAINFVGNNVTRVASNLSAGRAGAYYNMVKGQGAGKIKSAASTAKAVLFDDIGANTAQVAKNQGITKTVVAHAKNAAEGAKTVARHAKTNLKVAGSKIANSKVGTAITNAGSKVIDMTQAAGAKIVDTASGIPAEIAAKFPKASQWVSTLIEYAKKAFDVLQEKLLGMLKKNGAKNTSSLVKKIAEGLKNLTASKFFKMGKTFIAEALGGIGKAIAKSAASAATFLLSDLGMGLVGGLVGAANAENLFVADFESLDFGTKAKARLVAGVFQGLLNTSIGGWLDLANSVIYMITNLNIVAEVATIAFNILANDEQEKALKNAQADFQQKYEDHVQAEYDAYVENATKNGAEVMDFDTFKKSEVSTSIDDFNAEQHQTVGSKIWTGMKNTGKTIVSGVKKAASGISSFVKDPIGSVKSGLTSVSTKISAGVTSAVDSIKDSKLGKTVTTMGKMASDMGSFVKTQMSSISSWATGKSDKLELNELDQDDPMYGIKNGIVNAAKTIGAVPVAVTGIGKAIGNMFPKLKDMIAPSENNKVSDNGFDISKVKDSDYWRIPSSINTTTFGGMISAFKFWLGRVVMYLPFKLKTMATDAADSIKGAMSWVGDFLGFGNARASAGNGGTRMVLGGNGDAPDMENGFPYYSQNDPSIKNKSYKLSGRGSSVVDETMGMRGCGPTALAMVASKVKGGYGGNPYTPENMARLAEAGNYSTNIGTTSDYFTDVGSQLGMNVTRAEATPSNVARLLQAGQPVIIQGQSNNPNSPFTPSGHYVVGVGLDSRGNVKVNDPNGRSSSKSYSLNDLTSDANVVFGYSNRGDGSPLNGRGGFGKTLKRLFGGHGGDLSIVQAYCTNNACYKKGAKLNVKGLMLHSVGCPQPDAQVFVKRFNQNQPGGRDVCVHGFIDANTGVVYQTLPWDYVGWHGGGSSNSTHIGVEMCEPDCIKYTGGATFTCSNVDRAKAQLKTVYDAAVKLFAFLCKKFKLNPLAHGVIISHAEGHTLGIASGHADPDHMFNQLGMYSMDQFRQDVNRAMGGVNAKIVSTLNLSSSDSTSYSANGTSADLYAANTSISNSTSSSSLSSILGQLATAFYEPVRKAIFGDSSGFDTSSVINSLNSSIYGTSDSSSGYVSPYTDTNSRRDAVWAKLRKLGYSKEAAAGIMGNIQSESSFNPEAVGDGGKAYGLAQWHNYSGKTGRWLNMSNYAKSIGSNYRDILAQTEFIDKELDPSIPFRDTIAANAIKNRFGSMQNFRNSNSIGDVTSLFMTKFERPADQSSAAIARRTEKSRRIYETYKNNEPVVAGLGGFGGDDFSNPDKPINYRVPVKHGGYGHAKLDNTLKRYDDRMKATGGYGGSYDDSDVKQLLTSMLAEMRGTNDGINKFNEKDFSGNGNTINYYDNKSSNMNVNQSKSPSKTYQTPASMINPQIYAIAKKISSGKVTM